jgi:hypothetical protein
VAGLAFVARLALQDPPVADDAPDEVAVARKTIAVFRAMTYDVLRVQGDVIAEITTFEPALFDAPGLPPMPNR